MNSHTIRKKFLEFFASKGHEVVKSAPIVPENDPSLYFVNAGMVPFKDVFTGDQKRPYSRATSTQKCLRVSGKHNDLEQVGRTPKHHTFFEMLGNFSFGDYFKKDAIHFAWEFLTEVVGLDADRMVATVFAGDEETPGDEEAYQIWHKEIGLKKERIFRLGAKDNFWSMGATGPCGPCTEIHLMPDPSVEMKDALKAGGPESDERWIEVWNLVFMQFDRQDDGKLQPLAQTGVDTGMGLERLTALKNGLNTTYDTDLLLPIIKKAAEIAEVEYGKNNENDVSLRVIADHARAAVFSIADGVFPEKGRREYVLRRIMRRAIRHGKLLNIDECFFDQICLTVVDLMGDHFEELKEHRELIAKIAKAEEVSFRRTLDRGIDKLNAAIKKTKAQKKESLDVDFVGDLYATDGFPIDLTRLIAQEAGLDVDEEKAHQWVNKTHGATETKIGDQAIDLSYKKLHEEIKDTQFVGYQCHTPSAKLVGIISNNQIISEAKAGQEVELFFDQTSFYGRSGGQVGDRGYIENTSCKAEISDTSKPIAGLFSHHAKLLKGTLKLGDQFTLYVDYDRQKAIRANHSATHLLHHALREILGPHVTQKGSEVNPDQLRFDFSHFQQMTKEEIQNVEIRVNEEIQKNHSTSVQLMKFDDAKNVGAMALFGEKYEDDVRVVHIGESSVELCGGTHVERAGDIGLFRIISEEALALGVRRIVAQSGQRALAHCQQTENTLAQLAQKLKISPDQANSRVEKLLAQLKSQEKELSELKQKLATGGGGDDLMKKVKEINGVKTLITRIEGADPKTLRQAGDQLRDKLGEGILVLGCEFQEKATLLVMVSKSLTKTYHAGKLIKPLAEKVGGRGGGRPDMAQAGGSNPAALDDALQMVESLLI